MSTLTKLPVKYVLYTHFGYADQDFDSWNSGTNVSELDGVNYFAAHLDGLRELLTSPAYEGMLVLFFASGFEECLDGIAKGLTRDDLLRKDRLQFANQVRQEFDRMLSGHRDASHRIRVLTPIDFYDIFGRMRGFDVDNLRLWFVGLREGIRYDAPKIAEAIVRLRLLGTGVPVFRLDWDVIFRAERDPDSGSYKYISPPLQTWDCLSRLLQPKRAADAAAGQSHRTMPGSR